MIRLTVSPTCRLDRAAPPHPDSLEMTIAKRGSVAPTQGRFAQAGMSHQDDFGGIDLPVCFEVIHHPTVTPCPGGDCLSAVCRNVSFRWMTEEGENTFRISVLAVGEEVEVMDGGQPVTGVDDLFHRPARCLVAAWAVGILRRDDIRVRRNCLIPWKLKCRNTGTFVLTWFGRYISSRAFRSIPLWLNVISICLRVALPLTALWLSSNFL